MNVHDSYDSAAEAYAHHLASELDRKPLDRHLLNRFAEEARGRGLVADIGCGPGHVARYLHDRGVSIVGIDLSSAMITCAARLNPGLDFRVGDMRDLSLPSADLHCRTGRGLFHRALRAGRARARDARVPQSPGDWRPCARAFHVGTEVVHVDDLFGAAVRFTFVPCLPTDKIASRHSIRVARERPHS